MGGKTGTTTSSVAIPPEVLARYSAVNTQAQATATQPFQQYSTDPSAFVAPLNQEQNAATAQTNQYANAAQPAINYAEQGYTPEGFQQGVQGYMNPFLQNAMGSTAAQMNNVNQQQQQQLLGTAIQQGAFGGDRGNVAQAALMNQQNLAEGQTLGNMASQGFQSAAQNYQTGLGQIGALGVQGQQAGLQGAQAMMGAGTLGQQTTQAGQSALYNQFQQQQAYPFQVAQFLANIAEGTGALSGSTTTTTAPQSFFSDARLKEDIKRVGTAKNGLPIYTFKYKGDDTEQTHTGYMAQDVEKIHPEAVGESHGYKTVDYDKASEPVHRAFGGATNSEGGVVAPQHAAEGYFNGGDVVSPYDLSAILASQRQSYAPFQQGGLYGSSPAGTPGGKGVVPAANLPVAHLGIANPARAQQGDTLMGDVQGAMNIGDTIKKANDYRKDIVGQPAQAAKAAVPASGDTPAQAAVAAQPSTGMYGFGDFLKTLGQPQASAHGGVVGYADGGSVEPYQTDDPMSQVVSDTEKDKGQHGLMTAQNPTGQSSSTLGDISKIAAIPGEISGLGTMASTIGSGVGAAASGIGSFLSSLGPFTFALKDGGVAEHREHHATLGTVTGDPAPDDQTEITPDYVRDIAAKSAVKAGIDPTRPLQIGQLESAFNHNAVGDEGSSFGPWQMHYGNMSEKYPNGGLGDVFTKETGYDLRDPNVRSDPKAIQANSDWVANYMAKNGDSAWSTARQLDSKNTQANVASQSNNAPAESAPKDNGILSTLGNMFGIGSAQAQEAPKPGQKSLGDTLMSEQFLIPLLSGIGTMAGSNSRYLGAAILQGIGGGAKAYEDVQQNLASRGLTGAQTNVENTVAASNAQQVAQNDRHLDPLTKTEIIDMPNNKTMTRQEYLAAGSPPTRSMVAAGILQSNMSGISAQPAPNQAAPPPAQNAPAAAPAVAPAAPSIVSTPLPPPAAETPAATPFSVGNAGKMQLQKDNDIFNNSAPTVRTPLLADSTAAEKKIYDEANNAHDMGMTLNNLTSRILAEPDTGVASPGVINALKSHAADTYNNLMATIGHPEMAVAGQDLNNAAVIDKIHTGLGFLTTTNADQNSREALQAAFAGTPGTQMTKAAALDVVTSMYVAKQRALDQQKYLQEWKNQAAQNQDTGGQYLAQNAQAAFRQDHNDTSYQLEKHNLRNLLGPIDQNGNPIMNKGVPLPAPSASDKNGNPVKLFDLAANPTLSKYGDKTPQLVEKYAKSPYLSRYISNQ